MEGKPYSHYIKERKKAAKKQNTDIFNSRVNSGESVEDEKNRIFSFIEELKKKDYKVVLIIAHYDTLQIINAYVKNLSNKEMLEFKPQRGGLYRFEL